MCKGWTEQEADFLQFAKGGGLLTIVCAPKLASLPQTRRSGAGIETQRATKTDVRSISVQFNGLLNRLELPNVPARQLFPLFEVAEGLSAETDVTEELCC